ncbi:MAG TPA: DUF58 domain-containing protein [Phycisphaerae bacterium]|jgi:uncharacterized protein (DUF58 family)
MKVSHPKTNTADGQHATPVRARRRMMGDFSFTGNGAMFVVVAALIGVAAMAQQINLLFLLFGMCMGSLLVSGMLSGKPLRRVRIARLVPEAAVVGRPFEIRYILSNPSRLKRAYSIHLRERLDAEKIRGDCEAFAPCVAPQQSLEVAAPLVCLRRGRLPLSEIILSTRFPFGLFRKSATATIQNEMIIYPATGRLKIPIRQPRGLTGAISTRDLRAGPEAEEFHGLRDYARGDNPRWIHWRRSVRIGRLLVREMRRVQRPQLVLIVDPRVASTRPEDIHRREQVISAAATFCLAGLERGLAVGLVGLTAPPLVIPPVAGLEHRAKFLRELALIEPAEQVDPGEIAAQMHWPPAWAGHCVVLTSTEDQAIQRVSRIFAARCRSLESLVAGTPRFMQAIALEDDAG